MKILHIPAKTEHANRALVSYLPDSYTLPSNHPNFFGHSNYQECRALLNCLTQHGFACDVIGWNEDIQPLIGTKYDLFISLLSQLEHGRSLVHEHGKVIYYATSSHWIYHNAAEYNRLNQLRLRRGVTLKPRRQIKPSLFNDQIDEIWYLGNDFQKNTFSHINVPKHRINISTVSSSHTDPKHFSSSSRMNFLWFGSAGSVHKGLDWILEIFCRNKDLNLHVCGLANQESDFYSAYNDELLNQPNIHFHGWITPDKQEFHELCEQCAFIVSPSCSEGGGGATFQCMAAGLIPIVTRATSVDADHGFILHDDTIDELEKVIRLASQCSNDELSEKSIQSSRFVKENHTLENYQHSITKRIHSAAAELKPYSTANTENHPSDLFQLREIPSSHDINQLIQEVHNKEDEIQRLTRLVEEKEAQVQILCKELEKGSLRRKLSNLAKFCLNPK